MLRSSCMFVFQAEDGIRDLVRSRGLGDVYKRQRELTSIPRPALMADLEPASSRRTSTGASLVSGVSVSYTHLTLPTSDLV